MDNYLHMLKVVFTESSHIHVKTKAFFKKVKNMWEQLDMYARGHKRKFYMSFYGHIHMKVARFVNGILRDPTSGSCDDLCYNDLLVSLEITSFHE